MSAARPDAAGDGADGAPTFRRSGAWNQHASAALAAFMEASRASGYAKVVMKYGGLQCQAFVPGQEEPQEDKWDKLQQARITALQAEMARRTASSSTRAEKERQRKKAQASRRKAAKAAAASKHGGGENDGGGEAGAACANTRPLAPAPDPAPATAAHQVAAPAGSWEAAVSVGMAMTALLSKQHGKIDLNMVALPPQVRWRSVQAAGKSLRLPVGRGTVADTIDDGGLCDILLSGVDGKAADQAARVLVGRADDMDDS